MSLTRLGKNISKLASKKYGSNVEFANVCNVSEATVRRVIAGKQNLSLNLLQRICEALEVQMTDLLRDSGY